LAVLSRQTAEPAQFRNCFLIWSAILGPVAALLTWSLGWRFAGLGATIWLLPILQQVLALQPEQKTAPIYSRAIAAIHLDRYEDAEKAVIKELESCEDDFEGWMMLAELYANQFHDLPGAQELLRQTCDHPATTPSQFAVAHHRLADWQLKLAQDPDAARAALEEICRRHPRSHLDRMARLRIGQMPASREEWIARQGVKKIHLHTLRGPSRDSGAASSAPMSRQEAFARSQQCVQRLQSNPDDIAAREELARLWAEELDQVEMGVEQLDLLLAMRGVAPAKAAEWLGLLASWHLRYPQNLPAARAVLERLVRLHPQSPQGFAAQRRLNLLDLEAKMRQAAGARQERLS
jgi:tetratricopeptide (TPR) repeat protein